MNSPLSNKWFFLFILWVAFPALARAMAFACSSFLQGESLVAIQQGELKDRLSQFFGASTIKRTQLIFQGSVEVTRTYIKDGKETPYGSSTSNEADINLLLDPSVEPRGGIGVYDADLVIVGTQHAYNKLNFKINLFHSINGKPSPHNQLVHEEIEALRKLDEASGPTFQREYLADRLRQMLNEQVLVSIGPHSLILRQEVPEGNFQELAFLKDSEGNITSAEGHVTESIPGGRRIFQLKFRQLRRRPQI